MSKVESFLGTEYFFPVMCYVHCRCVLAVRMCYIVILEPLNDQLEGAIVVDSYIRPWGMARTARRMVLVTITRPTKVVQKD